MITIYNKESCKLTFDSGRSKPIFRWILFPCEYWDFSRSFSFFSFSLTSNSRIRFFLKSLFFSSSWFSFRRATAVAVMLPSLITWGSVPCSLPGVCFHHHGDCTFLTCSLNEMIHWSTVAFALNCSVKVVDAAAIELSFILVMRPLALTWCLLFVLPKLFLWRSNYSFCNIFFEVLFLSCF